MQHRSGSDRLLPVAGGAFINPRARLQPPGLSPTAAGADKSTGPAKPCQVLDTPLLRPKPRREFQKPSHPIPLYRPQPCYCRADPAQEHLANLCYLDRDSGRKLGKFHPREWTMSNRPVIVEVFSDNPCLISGSSIKALKNGIFYFSKFGISVLYVRRHLVEPMNLLVYPRIIITQILRYPTYADHLYSPANFRRVSVLTDILQVPIQIKAMVSLLGRPHNECQPGWMPWRAKSEDRRPRWNSCLDLWPRHASASSGSAPDS